VEASKKGRGFVKKLFFEMRLHLEDAIEYPIAMPDALINQMSEKWNGCFMFCVLRTDCRQERQGCFSWDEAPFLHHQSDLTNHAMD